MASMTSRFLVPAAAVLALAACSKPTASLPDDMSMGDPKAKVTVVEYASVACPVCAKFNNEVFPAFKRKYVDTGKVHYVAREAVTGNASLAASGFLMARCAGKDKYFQVTDAVYHAQDEIYEPGTETIRAGAGRDVLRRIAQSAGLSEDQFNKCISDEAALKAFATRTETSAEKDHIEGTPTFIVNGKKVDVGSLADLDAAIQPLLK
jgi:protein-disulfide isomerase